MVCVTNQQASAHTGSVGPQESAVCDEDVALAEGLSETNVCPTAKGGRGSGLFEQNAWNHIIVWILWHGITDWLCQ